MLTDTDLDGYVHHVSTSTRSPYVVKTGNGNLSSFYKSLFGGVEKPLCAAAPGMRGCENATGGTSWKYQLHPSLYDDHGKRRRLNSSCIVDTIMPKWEGMGTTAHKIKSKAEVARFLKRTEEHERGHAVACETVASIIRMFVSKMPDEVPLEQVSAVNAAFDTFVNNYYVKMGHASDKMFDNVTGHGGKYGAELGQKLEMEAGGLAGHISKYTHSH